MWTDRDYFPPLHNNRLVLFRPRRHQMCFISMQLSHCLC